MAAHAMVRSRIERWGDDRELAPDLALATGIVRSGALAELVEDAGEVVGG
jgi:hypothetical protein